MLSTLLCICITSLIFPSAVRAVSAPLSLSVEYSKIYKNVFELDDTLVMIRYNINYVTNPTETSSTTFLVTLKDDAGVAIASNAVADDGYGNKMVCIYFTPAQTATSIVWGSNYSVRLQGNPTVFVAVPFSDRSIVSTDWISSTTLTQGQSYFVVGMIQQTRVLETLNSITYTVNTVTGYRLSTTGVAYWNVILPGISKIAGATNVGAENIVYDNTTYSYPTKVASDAALSATMKQNFANIMDVFGIPWWAFGMMILVLVFMTVAGAVYQVSGGNTKLSTAMALPAGFVVAFLFSNVLVWIVFGVFFMVAVIIFSRFM